MSDTFAQRLGRLGIGPREITRALSQAKVVYVQAPPSPPAVLSDRVRADQCHDCKAHVGADGPFCSPVCRDRTYARIDELVRRTGNAA